MTRQQEQKRQGSITDFLTVRRKTAQSSAATPGSARVTPQEKVAKNSSISARTSKKAKLLCNGGDDPKAVKLPGVPSPGVSGWYATTPSNKTTCTVVKENLSCSRTTSSHFNTALQKPVECGTPVPLRIRNPPIAVGDESLPASTYRGSSSHIVTQETAVATQQPELRDAPQVACAKDVSDAPTATPKFTALRASEKYRHLLRKRRASPASSDDEIYVPPTPSSSAATAASVASTVTLQAAPDSSAKPKRVPGYIRYRHLVSQTAKLRLPDKYDVLESVFAALDQTLVFNQGQGHASVFVKIKKSVENLCQRSFELRHLAQILHIFPDAYKVKAICCLHNGEYVNTVSLEINYGFGGGLSGADRPDDGPAYRQACFVSSQMEKRKLILHDRLLTLMKAEHETFLAKRGFESHEVGRPLRQWHPDFDIDAVPDVSEAELPRVELFKRSTSGHLLLQRREKAAAALTMGCEDCKDSNIERDGGEDAARTAPPKQPDVPVAAHETDTAPSNERKSVSRPADAAEPTTPGATFRGSFKAAELLARIRSKEKSRVRDTMFGRTAEQVHKRALFSRLPEIIDAISFYFSSNKKTVMHLKDVVKMLMDSLRVPLSESEIVEHVTLLQEIVPDWISLSTLDTYQTTGSGPKLVQLNRAVMTAKEVKERCRAHAPSR